MSLLSVDGVYELHVALAELRQLLPNEIKVSYRMGGGGAKWNGALI